MKKKILIVIIVIIILLTGVSTVNAQLRFDIELLAPLVFAYGEYLEESYFVYTDYGYTFGQVLGIPFISLQYVPKNDGYFNIGIGIRGLSLIILNVLYPNIMFELDLKHIVFTLNFGGFFYSFLAIPYLFFDNPFLVYYYPLSVTDFTISIKGGKRFRYGAGIILLQDYWEFNEYYNTYKYLMFFVFIKWVFD